MAQGTDILLSFQWGGIRLRETRLTGTYFHLAKMQVNRLEQISESEMLLVHEAENRRDPGYFLPLQEPVPFPTHEDYYGKYLQRRQMWKLPGLRLEARVHHAEEGFRLALRSIGGVPGVPFVVEFLFETPGFWETRETSMAAESGSCLLLRKGSGVFRRRGDAVRIGPRADVHQWGRSIHQEADFFRVLIPLFTPFERLVEIQLGSWMPGGAQFEPVVNVAKH